MREHFELTSSGDGHGIERNTCQRTQIRLFTGLAVCLAVSLVAIGCSASRATREQSKDIISGGLKEQTTNPQSNLYVVQSGDMLKIAVTEYPEFDTSSVVSPTGTISLRIIGDIQAAGTTRDKLTSQITQRLSDFVRPPVHVSITVINALSQKVSVLGAVGRQDNYPLTSDMSLLQVLAVAGGTTPEADVQHIRIIRAGDTRHVIEVDLTQYLDQGGGSELPPIKAGDIVFVPKEENVVRELSNFFRDAIFLFSFFAVAK